MLSIRFSRIVCSAVAISILLLLVGSPGFCVAHKMLKEAGPFVSKSNKIQKFSSKIEVGDQHKTSPLYLTFFNGYGGKPGYSWVRVYLNTDGRSMVLADESTFRVNRAKTVEVTGSIPTASKGAAQIIIEAQGRPGAIFAWELTTVESKISLLKTTAITPGQTCLLHGTGFSANSNEVQVYIAGKRAKILSALPTLLKVQAPKKLKGKKVSVRVVSGGNSSNTISVALAHLPPVLNSISPLGGPVGGVLSIRGANFSRVPDQNIVKIGPYTAPVISVADDGTLVCRIPRWFGYTTLPVRVITNGMPSTNTLTFWCMNRYYGGNPNASVYHYD